jgi:glycosyltransferase involved in cell wall biosynthesis
MCARSLARVEGEEWIGFARTATLRVTVCMASMRPFTIVAGDFVRTGGMDRANFALAEFLAKAGSEVHLVGHRVSAELAACPNVAFHRVPKPFNSYSLGVPLLAAAGWVHARSVARRRGAVVVNGGNCVFPDINWVHYVHAAFDPVIGQNEWWGARSRANHRLNVLMERSALRTAKVIVVNSERTRSDVIECVGVPAERVHTVYLGVDASRFGLVGTEEKRRARLALGWKDGRPRIVFVGALDDRRKGFDVLYDAWRTLCSSSSWDVDLVVVGTGGELPSWRERASRDGIALRIDFLGFRDDVPQLLAACDALVAPSRYEPYGLAVHEALCRGLPALVPPTAGIAERYPVSLRGLILDDAQSSQAVTLALEGWRRNASSLQPELRAFADELRARSWDDVARDVVALSDARI